MIEIREEQPDDIEAIRLLNIRAFGRSQEANIVDKLRQSCEDLLSLVAIVENQVVGHILFSPVTIECEDRLIRGMGLAPMAVMPEYQKQGIGSKLIRTGTAKLKRDRCPFVIVLGHAGYYPQFGFEPASRYGIRCEWEVEDDAFMILVADKSKLQGAAGVTRYLPEFGEAM